MPILLLDNPVTDFRLWQATALPTNGDRSCGKGITYDVMSQYEDGIDFVRHVKPYNSYREASKSYCRYFAYDVNLRFILLHWRSGWKSPPSTLILRQSLLDLANSYRRNAIDHVLFPDWGFTDKDNFLTHSDFLSLLDEVLGNTGMIIGVNKPQ